ncbi:hypothetical protein CH370_15185 [Leptospira kmetyi]|nr:hypothetical protein CH370_15185 [Leptospira kmetyi]
MIFKNDFVHHETSIFKSDKICASVSGKNILKSAFSLLLVGLLFSCSTPFPDVNSSVLLLGLLNQNNTADNGTNNPSNPNLLFKYIFVTTASTNGALGNIAGADTKCANEKNANFASLPGTGTDYKALIASPTRRACTTAFCTTTAQNISWVLLPNQDYYKGTVASPVKVFTTNAGGVVVFPTLSVIDPGAVSWWTGIEADWTTSVDHCSSWGDGTAGSSAQYGVGNSTADTSIAAGFTQPCNSSRKLVCVRQ